MPDFSTCHFQPILCTNGLQSHENIQKKRKLFQKAVLSIITWKAARSGKPSHPTSCLSEGPGSGVFVLNGRVPSLPARGEKGTRLHRPFLFPPLKSCSLWRRDLGVTFKGTLGPLLSGALVSVLLPIWWHDAVAEPGARPLDLRRMCYMRLIETGG